MEQYKENPGTGGTAPGRGNLQSNSIIILPHTESSEIQVLGCIMQEGGLIANVDLSPSDFYLEKHQAIYSIMKDMERHGMPIDVGTLHEQIRKAGQEELTGGFMYLSYLDRQTLSTANFNYHVRQVKEAKAKRDLVSGLYALLQQTTNGGSLASIQRGISSLIQVADSQTERPTMKKEAFYGLAGEIVNFISPHSEADPVLHLVNILTAYGNVIGNQSYFPVEADQHHMRLNFVAVGESAKGRKGTSWGYTKLAFGTIDADWLGRVKAGLSSGEGLIWAVRDPIVKTKDGEERILDVGVDDKRLLLLESEFARILRVMEREGNTLSAIIRCAWDTGDLHILTTGRQHPNASATEAHISIIGHVTREELLRHLSTTEMANGFGNRFLWLYVRRSKVLPFGGGLKTEDLNLVIEKLRKAVDFGKKAGEITWAEETRPLWEAVYPKLSEGKSGLIGALTARAEAYVTRLACIYALLEHSTEIKPEHLRAALAVWEYAEASVKFIFGNSLGGPLVSELRDALSQRPMTKTEINDYFKGHKSSRQINEALQTLQKTGKAKNQDIKTRGRKKEVWSLDNASAEKAENAEKG